jgi:hypothetical protein
LTGDERERERERGRTGDSQRRAVLVRSGVNVDVDLHKAVRAGPEESPQRGRIMMRMITLGFFSHNQYISASTSARITTTLEKVKDIGSRTFRVDDGEKLKKT